MTRASGLGYIAGMPVVPRARAGCPLFGIEVPAAQARLVLLAAPWEATVSYGRGTAAAPEAIRRASAQVELFDPQLGCPHRHGLALIAASPALLARAAEAARWGLEVIAAAQAGEAAPLAAVARVNELSVWLDEHLLTQARRWLSGGKRVAVIGGSHAVAFANIKAHAERYPGLGVLQFDAHADLRVAYQGFVGSHASVMQRVMAELPNVAALVTVGVRDLCEQEYDEAQQNSRIHHFYDFQMRQHLAAGKPLQVWCDRVVAALPEQVYISFDIDGLTPALCPHTGTPVPGGLSFGQALALLDALLRHGRTIVGFDLCEVAPGADEWDANVGARLLYKLAGYMFLSQSDGADATIAG